MQCWKYSKLDANWLMQAETHEFPLTSENLQDVSSWNQLIIISYLKLSLLPRTFGCWRILHALGKFHVHSYMFLASQLYIWSQDFLSEQHLSVFCHNLSVLMADWFTLPFSSIVKHEKMYCLMQHISAKGCKDLQMKQREIGIKST